MKCQQVLVEYTTRMTNNPKKSVVPRSTTLQYLEVVVCSTEVITEECGKMMYKRQYLDFAESYDGGKLSDAQACHQWSA